VRPRSAPVSAPPPVIPERGPAPERLIVGRVAAAHGLRGEFRMVIVTNHPEYLPILRTVYLDGGPEPWPVRRIHPLPGGKEALVRLAGLATAEDAAALRGQRVWSEREALPPLPEGEYYHYQLIGLDVVDTEGKLLGRLAEIIETGANDVYVVRGPAGEMLLPAIEEVVREVDLEAGRMVVRPQEYY
jgi:16S rRNA processing protein RimM